MPAISFNQDDKKLVLTETLRVFETPTNIEPVEAANYSKIIAEATQRERYYINSADTDYWFYGRFVTAANISSTILIVDHPYPKFNQVSLVLQPLSDNPLILHSGIDRQFSERPTETRLLAFPLQLRANTHYEFLIKVHSLAKQPFAVSLQQPKNYLLNITNTEFLWGLFFGVFIIAAAYNLLIYVATQQRVYLYYMCFIVSSGLAQAGLTGHGHYYLWSEATHWNNNSNLFFVGLASIFGILFTQAFLRTKDCAPLIDKLLRFTLWPSGLMIFASQVLPYNLGTVISDICMFWLLILTISAGIYSYKSGEKTARFFLLGWGSLMFCMLFYILMMRGFIAPNDFNLFAPQIGGTLEILIITLAIGERIKQDRQAKLKAMALQDTTIGKLKMVEEALTQQAMHDTNTGLANQNMLYDAIERALKQENTTDFYLVLVKTKGMREINNTLGRYVGDEVTNFIGNNLQRCIYMMPKEYKFPLNTRGEYLAITQGVVFAFFVQAPDESLALETVKDTLNKLPKRFELNSITLEVEICAGICCADQANGSREIWVRHTFVAIEQASHFSQLCQLYDESYNPYNKRRLELINSLRHAIDEDELELYLQPQLDAQNQTIIGAEALIRWSHPTHGFVPPDEFILLAENSGVIKPLTRWVISNALSLLKQLHTKGYLIDISINISPSNLEEEDLTSFIVNSLNKYQMDSRYITLEITETETLANSKKATQTIMAWHELGFDTSIDDFGTGYSSLSYLKRLPMKELKIDRSFIKDMLEDENDLHIVEAALTIGHSLKMRVVAEGVEDENLLNRLAAMGCDLIQGYHLTRPLPIEEFTAWLDQCGYALGHPKLRHFSRKSGSGNQAS